MFLKFQNIHKYIGNISQTAITYSKLITETLEQGAKYVQS